MDKSTPAAPLSIMECFATPVWCKNAENFEAINSELLKLLRQLQTENAAGLQYTNSGGWQSDRFDVNRSPLFRDLILGFTREVGATLSVKPNAKIILDNCWFNLNRKDSYNRAHTHPNSMLSGCYYVKTPEGCGDIVFSDPRAQASCVLFPTVRLNKFTVLTVRFHPQPGSIVMFPSWLLHYVESNDSTDERVSVAFNMIITE